MTHPPAAPNYIEQQAGSLQSGDHLLLPDGNRSAEIQRVDVETDDFGTPAMVLATLTRRRRPADRGGINGPDHRGDAEAGDPTLPRTPAPRCSRVEPAAD